MASPKTTKICGWVILITGIVLVILMIFAIFGGAQVWVPLGMGGLFILMGWRMKTTGKM